MPMPRRRRKKTKLILSIIVGLGIIAGGAFAWTNRLSLQRSLERAQLPKASPYYQVSPVTNIPATTPVNDPPTTTVAPNIPAPSPLVSPTGNTTALPAEVNLDVPFTAQAPHANWDLPFKEFCEEASVLMAMHYITDEPIGGPDAATAEMEAIQAFEENRFGYYKDTTIEETDIILREHYNYQQTQLVQNPTITDIKQALAQGKVVIAPAAGRELGNPNFQSPGPLYHMFVVKGYTRNGQFIVNDPGTRRGADFLYDEEVVMNALHNWRSDENINAGSKVILVVG